MGVDVFVHWPGSDANQLAKRLADLEDHEVSLSMITNRGIKVWPDGFKETFCTDHWRCRFKPTAGTLQKSKIVQLLAKALDKNIDTIKTENLYAFEGKPAYSLGQGQ